MLSHLILFELPLSIIFFELSELSDVLLELPLSLPNLFFDNQLELTLSQLTFLAEVSESEGAHERESRPREHICGDHTTA
jgi:hypothetical protein